MKRELAMTTGGMLPGAAARQSVNTRERLSGLVSLVRPVFFVLTPINAASAAVLAYGGFLPLVKCLAGFFAVAFASCAVNVFNDFIDRHRDKRIWPERALPGGRVRPGEALALAITTAFVSLAITWLAFNPAAFAVLLAALVLGGMYSVYLRDWIGYLSLPPIVGLIYLGGWAAVSPGSLFHSFLPWYLFLLGAVWQAAHIMTYYPLHLTPGEPVPPALLFRPSPGAAVKMGLAFTGLTLVLALELPLLAPQLRMPYLVVVAGAGALAVFASLRLLRNVRDRRNCLQAFVSISALRMAVSAAILLSFLWFLK
jgi:4-hydroxybenzoate polyprenyltransferase